MKRKHKGTRERRQTIPVWTYEQARGALPYLSSIMRSLREHRIEALQQDRFARKLARQPGRPDRHRIIADQEAKDEAERAAGRFKGTLEELHSLGVYCLDPVRGEAAIPFVQEEQLAWFLFDLFEPDPLRFWRFHSDPLDMRRPVLNAQKGLQDLGQVV